MVPSIKLSEVTEIVVSSYYGKYKCFRKIHTDLNGVQVVEGTIILTKDDLRKMLECFDD